LTKFVVAQNAHDLKAVGEILQDSPQMFWITRGQVYWGRDAALKRFGEYYQGTWALEPKTNEIKLVELSPDVAQLFAPTVFRIAPPGQTAQPSLFLLNQIYVRTAGGYAGHNTIFGRVAAAHEDDRDDLCAPLNCLACRPGKR
jgi:hypothetical protein